jgi:hypothetical protein
MDPPLVRNCRPAYTDRAARCRDERTMDIELSVLPAEAVEALVVRHEPVRLMRDGQEVATVVPARPVFRSHKALRERVGRLDTTVAQELRAERDLG